MTSVLKGGIATITFGHPAQNAMPGAQLARLEAAIVAAGEDEAVRVVVLQSEGDRTFCAGASFDELANIADFEQGKAFFLGFARVINAMRKCPKFIIGRVQGKAVGGGVGLAAATDYCVATQHAAVKLSELAVGIGPFVVGPAVERKMGKWAMTHLAINATAWESAEWAQQHGLYAQVFPDVALMDAYVAQLSEQLAHSHPAAMRQLKQVFWEDAAHWDELLAARAEMSGQLVLSEFTKAAIAKFKAGRT